MNIPNFAPELLIGASIIVGIILIRTPRSRLFLQENSGAIGVVFALTAGMYVLKEHELSQHNDRLDRTRAYIERIETGTVHASRQWMDLHWIKNRGLINKIDEASNGAAVDRDTAKNLLANYLKDFEETDIEDLENIEHLMRLFYFYADLAKCVELGLCDGETACDIFSKDIGQFYVLHYKFIHKWRQVSFERNFRVIKTLGPIYLTSQK